MNWKPNVYRICLAFTFPWVVAGEGFKGDHLVTSEFYPPDEPRCTVKVALVLCDGDSNSYGTTFDRQFNQTLTLLKSVLITTDDCVHVLLISNRKRNFDLIKVEVFENPETAWDHRFTRRLKLEFVQLKYPPGTSWMRELFRPCATFRLFLPELLSQHDAIIYTDTDFIFLRSIRGLWEEMGKFSPTALAGMVPRCVGCYRPRTDSERHTPITISNSGTSGYNSGIMLMNLTRMRSKQWTKKILAVGVKYQKKLVLPDQDMLNIYFDEFQNHMHELTCDWNFRSFQCFPNKICQNLVTGGISAIHGNRLSFVRKTYEPVFRSTFLTFKNTPLTSTFDLKEFVLRVKSGLDVEKSKEKPSACAKMPQFEDHLLRRLEEKLGGNSTTPKFIT